MIVTYINIMMTSTKNKIPRRYRTIATIAVVISISIIVLLTQNMTFSRSYISDLENPFFDVFTLYFYDEKDEAKNRLRQLMGEDKYRTHAYINYGILNEREKNYTGAEAYYRKALKEGDHNSLLYLFSLIDSAFPSKMLSLLDSCSGMDSSRTYWIEYEKAAHYMKANNTEKAFGCLEKAVRSGFYSVQLLSSDPVFGAVRDHPRYAALLRETGNNRSNFRSIKQALEKAEEIFLEKQPYGIAKELKQYLDLDIRRLPAVEEQLASLLKTDIQFRDRCVLLYWLAGLRVKKGDISGAQRYLTQFTAMINSGSADKTGFKQVVQAYQKDILHNDPVMKKLIQ
jgi:tetratricopeptide (TPR) repeat protein